MTKIRTFRTPEAMKKWRAKNAGRYQMQEVFINNAYGIEYRELRKM